MGYKTKTDERGNVLRVRTWVENFVDEYTGKVVSINREELIKVNGVAVKFYRTSELKAMTPSQRKAIEIKWR